VAEVDSDGGGGANEGSRVGMVPGGPIDEAKECKNTMDACFLDSTGYWKRLVCVTPKK
jgi:hypothetical protein